MADEIKRSSVPVAIEDSARRELEKIKVRGIERLLADSASARAVRLSEEAWRKLLRNAIAGARSGRGLRGEQKTLSAGTVDAAAQAICPLYPFC